MIDAIVFDIGNVLLRFDFGIAVARIAPHCGVAIGAIHQTLDPLKIELETGRLSGDAFLKEVTRLLRFEGDPALLRLAWQEIFSPIEATHQLVERLAKAYPLYILSNTNGIHADYFLKEYGVFAHFKDRVFSHEVGVMKPDEGIYRIAVEQFGLTPSRTLFLDDLKPNVEAASRAGWVAHQYSEHSHDSLLQTIEKLGMALV